MSNVKARADFGPNEVAQTCDHEREVTQARNTNLHLFSELQIPKVKAH